MALVEIADLKVSFRQYGGTIDAVRGISFSVEPGESLGIVGESGSGKSVSCNALMRLLPATAEPAASRKARRGFQGVRLTRHSWHMAE